MSFELFATGDEPTDIPFGVPITYVVDSRENVVAWFRVIEAGIETPTLEYEIRQFDDRNNSMVIKLPLDLTAWVPNPVSLKSEIRRQLDRLAKEGELGADDESGGVVG